MTRNHLPYPYDFTQRFTCDSTDHNLSCDAYDNEYLVSKIIRFSRFIEIYPIKTWQQKLLNACCSR